MMIDWVLFAFFGWFIIASVTVSLIVIHLLYKIYVKLASIESYLNQINHSTRKTYNATNEGYRS